MPFPPLAKKISVGALFAVNALTFTNSTIMGHKMYGSMNDPEGSDAPSPAASIVLAPLITGTMWIYNNDEKKGINDEYENIPLMLIADQSNKFLPKPADTALAVAFSAAGIPGAWVGQTLGTVTGMASSIYGALTETPQKTPAPQ